jgi:LuxR family transcriptional regulator, maltose regulon positive regulatory protein
MLSPAKISRPRLPPVAERPRLLALLDSGRARGLVWVAGAPGSGKTTAVARWIEARELSCLWFQVDAGDRDPATFFHHLARAVRAAARRRPALPTFRAEYAGDPVAFARRLFRAAWAHLPRQEVVVLDGLEAAHGALDGVLRAAIDEAPPGSAVVVTSRDPPPPALARRGLERGLALLSPDDLRLDADECGALAAVRGRRLGPAEREALVDRAQGWAAGILLLLEADGAAGWPASRAVAPALLFEYFAGEVLDRVDAEARRVLLEVALLPRVGGRLARRLTGSARAPRILADLARRGWFTLRHEGPGAEAVYQFHPLFLAFLRERAEEELPPERLAVLRRAAAAALEEVGAVEEAVALLDAAGAYDALAALLVAHAPGLLRAGRAAALSDWIALVPPERRAREPWLLLHLGEARLGVDPADAARQLEAAYAGFRERDDAAGQSAALATLVQTHLYAWTDLTPLDRWIAGWERLRAGAPPMAPEDEDREAVALLAALVYRQPDHPRLPALRERAGEVARAGLDPRLRAMAGRVLVQDALWRGETARAEAALEAIRPLAAGGDLDPIVTLAVHTIDAEWRRGRGDREGARAVSEGALRLAEDTGTHLWDLTLLGTLALVAIAEDRADDAASLCRRCAAAADPARRLNVAFLRHLEALVALRAGRLERAAALARASVELARAAGAPFAQAFCELGAAQVLLRAADPAGHAHLAAARAAGARMDSALVEFSARAVEALAALAARDPAVLDHLRGALRLARERDLVETPILSDAELARLCATALEHGIEPERAVDVVRRLGLAPPSGSEALAAWPRPVVLRTLGALALEPPAPDGSHRPVTLLAALVAEGGTDVPQARLAAELWPDASEEAAAHALETTLYRLRRLLGREDAVVQRRRRLSLDLRVCFADALALERLAARAVALLDAGGSRVGEAMAVAQQVVELYRGPFLAGEEGAAWVLAARGRLRRKIGRVLEGIACRAGAGSVEALAARIRAADPAALPAPA